MIIEGIKSFIMNASEEKSLFPRTKYTISFIWSE